MTSKLLSLLLFIKFLLFALIEEVYFFSFIRNWNYILSGMGCRYKCCKVTLSHNCHSLELSCSPVKLKSVMWNLICQYPCAENVEKRMMEWRFYNLRANWNPKFPKNVLLQLEAFMKLIAAIIAKLVTGKITITRCCIDHINCGNRR